MSGRDRIDAAANEWMGTAAPEAKPEPAPRGRQMSAFLLRLARRLGRDADELAAEIPPDTLRRTKYPVIERAGECGLRFYAHDEGIDGEPSA